MKIVHSSQFTVHSKTTKSDERTNGEPTNQEGFTFVEIIVASAVFLTILSFATINILGAQRSASLTTTTDVLINDVASQQLKAIVQETDAALTNQSYGIYFTQGGYTMFRGNTYSSSNASNYQIVLDNSLEFSSISLPNSQIVFATGSGAMVGFVAGQNSVALKDLTNGQTKTIQFNKFGVVTNVQ